MELTLADEAATQDLGAALATALPDLRRQGLLLTLTGELGTGKTTLARGLLRALGVTGTIRSPTYTLVEPYETAAGAIHHLDLYRLAGGAAELEALGYRDYRGLAGLVIVEWPERGGIGVAGTDLAIWLEHDPMGRRARIRASTAAGREWYRRLTERLQTHQLDGVSL